MTSTTGWSQTEERWLSRDQDVEGHVSDMVDVWSLRPERWRLHTDGGWIWIGPGDTGMDARVAQLSLAEAERVFRTTPDDAIQVIHLYDCRRELVG